MSLTEAEGGELPKLSQDAFGGAFVDAIVFSPVEESFAQAVGGSGFALLGDGPAEQIAGGKIESGDPLRGQDDLFLIDENPECLGQSFFEVRMRIFGYFFAVEPVKEYLLHSRFGRTGANQGQRKGDVVRLAGLKVAKQRP